ncbi:hypothetical protein JXQ70_19100 [bacterium]|nr:hypothetical protein [bacterium]
MRSITMKSVITVILSSLVICLMVTCSDDDSSVTEPLEIRSFTITPEVGQAGDLFVFSWETTGAKRVWIEPAISEQDLPVSGSVSVQVHYSAWYCLTAQADESTITARAWVQVSYPGGSMWDSPRADTSNSASSRWSGPSVGSLDWVYPFDDSFGDERHITLAGDNSVSVSLHSDHDDGGYMINLNPDGLPKFEQNWNMSEQVIAPSGVFYGSGTTRKTLLALNPDGSQRWELDLNSDNLALIRRAIYVNQQEKIFVHDMFHAMMQDYARLVVINSAGEIEYATGADHYFYEGFALNGDSSFVYTETIQYPGLHCVNDRLEPIWKVTGDFRGLPVTDENRRIFCHFCQDNTYSLKVLNSQGHEIWQVFYPDSIRDTSSIAWNGTIMYVILQEGSQGILLGAIVPDQDVIELAWTVPLQGHFKQSEVVVDSQNRAYVSTGEYIYAFDSDGNMLWQYSCPGEKLQALTLSRDGTLYVAGQSQLYAFRD